MGMGPTRHLLMIEITVPTEVPRDGEGPRALLYATSSGLGGSGLDTTALEGVLAAYRVGFLSRVLCYANRQQEIPRPIVRSLQRHPIRLLSCLGSRDYYAAKKTTTDS